MFIKSHPLGTCTATIAVGANICSLKLKIHELSLAKEDDFERKTNMFAIIGGEEMTEKIVFNGSSKFGRNSKYRSI